MKKGLIFAALVLDISLLGTCFKGYGMLFIALAVNIGEQ